MVVVLKDTGAISALEALEPAVQKAALWAIDKAAAKARTLAEKRAYAQVAFPARYLSPSQGRLTVSQRPRNSALRAVITGRSEPTSLARFARGSSKGGVSVRVKAGGSSTRIARAFLMNLRSGNTGLAVRTADGEEPSGAYKPKKIGRNLWLLYGPSVDQVLLRPGAPTTVFREIEPEILAFMEAEFDRVLNMERNRG